MAYRIGSWERAENAALVELVKRINAAAHDTAAIEIGRNAFLGEIPPGRYDCFAMLLTGGTSEQIWNTTVASLNLQGLILGLYSDRAKALAVIEMMFASHPIERLENIMIWRIEGNPTLRTDPFEMQGGRVARFWFFSMPIRCVIDVAG